MHEDFCLSELKMHIERKAHDHILWYRVTPRHDPQIISNQSCDSRVNDAF